MRYMESNKGVAWVGQPDTLEAAKALEGRGMVVKVGEFEGKPYYRMTRKGETSMGIGVEAGSLKTQLGAVSLEPKGALP